MFAAVVMAVIFFRIVSYEFNGRFANVANPQSEFSHILSGGKNSSASSAFFIILSTSSISLVLGFITPSPRVIFLFRKLFLKSFLISPARGVLNSSASIPTGSLSKNLLILSYAPSSNTLSSVVQFPRQTCIALNTSFCSATYSKTGFNNLSANSNSWSTLTFSDKAPQ